MSFYKKVKTYVNEHGITSIVPTSDMSALVAGVINDEFGFIGPTAESVFLCTHKYYTRVAVGDCDARVYSPWEPDIYSVPFPYYLKAPYSNLGVLGFAIRSKEDLDHALEIARRELPIMNEPIVGLIKEKINLEKYPYAVEPVMLVESLRSGNQVTVEGYVYNGEVVPIIITDTNFFPGTKHFESFSAPTRYSEKEQQQLKQKTISDIAKVGLNNTFFNVEYALVDGEWTLIEINARMARCFKKLYKHVFGFKQSKASIDLSCGKRPDTVSMPICVGMECNIVTTRQGRAKDIIPYSAYAKEKVGWIFSEEEQVTQHGDHGIVLGKMYKFADTFLELEEELKKLPRLLE